MEVKQEDPVDAQVSNTLYISYPVYKVSLWKSVIGIPLPQEFQLQSRAALKEKATLEYPARRGYLFSPL